MSNERAAVTQIRNEGDHLHGIHKLLPRIEAALQAEGEKSSCALGTILLLQRMGFISAETSIANPTNLRMLLEESCHFQSIVGVLLHTQWQCLHAHGNHEGIEGADAHAHVTQPKGASCDNEGKPGLSLGSKHVRHRPMFAKRLVNLEAVVGITRF